MLFDFCNFIEELRNHKEAKKRHAIRCYEKYCGQILPIINQNLFYIDYLEKFDVIEFALPEEYKEDFDYELLLRLIAGSLASRYEFVPLGGNYINEKLEFNIIVISNDTKIIQPVSSLWDSQIKRLFEIYIEEILYLQILMARDMKENKIISEERQTKILVHNNKIREINLFLKPATSKWKLTNEIFKINL